MIFLDSISKMSFDGGGGLTWLLVIYVVALLGGLVLRFCPPVTLRTMKNKKIFDWKNIFGAGLFGQKTNDKMGRGCFWFSANFCLALLLYSCLAEVHIMYSIQLYCNLLVIFSEKRDFKNKLCYLINEFWWGVWGVDSIILQCIVPVIKDLVLRFCQHMTLWAI